MAERALADRSGVEFNCDCRDGPLGRGVFTVGESPRHQLAWHTLPSETLTPRSIGQYILLFWKKRNLVSFFAKAVNASFMNCARGLRGVHFL